MAGNATKAYVKSDPSGGRPRATITTWHEKLDETGRKNCRWLVQRTCRSVVADNQRRRRHRLDTANDHTRLHPHRVTSHPVTSHGVTSQRRRQSPQLMSSDKRTASIQVNRSFVQRLIMTSSKSAQLRHMDHRNTCRHTLSGLVHGLFNPQAEWITTDFAN